MFEFYEGYLITKKNEEENSTTEKNGNGSVPTRKNSMPFKTFIDDICYKKIKTLNIFSIPKREVKERAYTYTPTNNVPLENWRNKKSIQSTNINNTNSNVNCNGNGNGNYILKQTNKINEYNYNNKNSK